MAAIASTELIAELERAVRAKPGRTGKVLRGLADLLSVMADRLDARQLEIFDEMMIRLMDHVEAPALAELGNGLADIACAQLKVVQRLARHEDAAVASPILQRSAQLSDEGLVEIASSRGPSHGAAIAQRKRVGEAVVDVLLDHGDTSVCVQLAKNGGAKFSPNGFAKLRRMAERNDELADLLVSRTDVPAEVLRELLSRLPRSVRARLLRTCSPELRAPIMAAIESVEVGIVAKVPEKIDYSEAQAKIVELNKQGKLNDSTVNRFATWREYRNLIAALSHLATVPVETIEPLVHEGDFYGVIVACHASRLNWTTTQAVIGNRPNQPKLSPADIAQAQAAFDSLNLSASQRIIRFGSVGDFAQKFQRHDASTAEVG
ncbi:MAG: DUF2336 domain-containing protein [Bradyrhizobium sp.]|nr:DUF2336 domain-containing protein [Bradyrhizobium sp.]